MKRSVCFIAVAAILVLLVGGCAIPRACPEEGIWYCQELDIYLNMENGTGMYLSDNGGYEPLFVDIDYGTGFFIRFCESSFSDEYGNCESLYTDYKFRNDILTLKDRDSGKVYEFIEVDGDMYPKG